MHMHKCANTHLENVERRVRGLRSPDREGHQVSREKKQRNLNSRVTYSQLSTSQGHEGVTIASKKLSVIQEQNCI